MDETMELMRELTEASGIPGYEGAVRAVIRKYLEPITVIEQDNLGSIICKKEGSCGSPKVMLVGHMDELGFMVKFITEEGFIKFSPLGLWWNQVMLAQRVVVKTSKGDVPGVIGAKPPHLLAPEERKKMVEMDDMFIDVGATSEEQARSEFGVRPGDPVVPVSEFTVLKNGKMYLAKAWDDRVGCALFVDIIKKLSGHVHSNTIFGVGTVREEFGLRGATTSAYAVVPDVGIVLEGTIGGDVPGCKKEESQEELGKGPSIVVGDHSMIPNLRLRDLFIDTAEGNGIPYQLAFVRGGTDATAIHINAKGVPSIVIGVPARYIHSHVGIIHRDDYDNAVKLVLAVLGKLDTDTVRSFTS